ncbi:MAG: glutamate racemase [Defluviitaleaceae bacterium]|nr:glutamate racemase [Defluviitaleaceae bacterium]MCL2835536.1 glutamate racemase [Defluviitaleaceae bacterium]
MPADRNAPIGIFDSGVGGLTVARRVMLDMPEERIVYFGDTARAPYGIRTKERITAQSMQIMRFLETHGLKMAIIACNTICVSSYYELTGAFDVPIMEIVSPAAADCVNGSPPAVKVGVIATAATVKSEGYRIEIHKLNPRAEVLQKACPDLVTLAERGLAESAAGALQCEIYLRSFKEARIDTLVLGCTHFPLFYGHIAAYMGGNVRLIDPAAASGAKVKKELAEAGLAAERRDKPEHAFYISGDPGTFEQIARNILGKPVRPEKINICKY